jgi:hypothetical protein
VGEIQRIYDIGGQDPTDICDVVDGIQVEKVKTASQSKSQTLYGSSTLSALAALGAVNLPDLLLATLVAHSE